MVVEALKIDLEALANDANFDVSSWINQLLKESEQGGEEDTETSSGVLSIADSKVLAY